MPLKWLICPDGERIEPAACLAEGGCRMGTRCAARSFLNMAAQDRKWTGKPSCTQLIQGTMSAFLKITKDYAIKPDSRAFAVIGTRGHKALEMAGADDELSDLEVRFADSDISGIADAIETEAGVTILSDTKTSGSYKVAKALGIVIVDEPTDEVYKSGKRKGEPKTRKVMKNDPAAADMWEWELQLGFYRMKWEEMTGKKVDQLKIQCICRDGNTYVARNRGITRNVYYFPVPILPDAQVKVYFADKKQALLKALEDGRWDHECTAAENWDGVKCASYCEVAEYCRLGKYLKKTKEEDDMVIKGLSDVRRLPRLGKIRLGIKKVSQKSGKEYPAEIDYFKLDPQTPSELENKNLCDEFHRLYGDQPKQIKIMFPVSDPEIFFPQFYKRYGSSTLLKCKGDGDTAVCATPDFAKGLRSLGQSEQGLPRVECKGKDCMYYKAKECTEAAVLQVLIPELRGAGVWQIGTGSYHSIVNLNSCIDYIRAVAGRVHMIPLILERRPQDIAYEGKKTKHYIMHINMDFSLADLQKFALVDPTRILLELPEPTVDKDDIDVLPGGTEVVDKRTGEVTSVVDVPDPVQEADSPMDQLETRVLPDGQLETILPGVNPAKAAKPADGPTLDEVAKQNKEWFE